MESIFFQFYLHIFFRKKMWKIIKWRKWWAKSEEKSLGGVLEFFLMPCPPPPFQGKSEMGHHAELSTSIILTLHLCDKGITSYTVSYRVWDWYHSNPLKEVNLDLTIFITPWSRYRYRTTPEGYLAAEDAHTRLYDEKSSEIPNKAKAIK